MKGEREKNQQEQYLDGRCSYYHPEHGCQGLTRDLLGCLQKINNMVQHKWRAETGRFFSLQYEELDRSHSQESQRTFFRDNPKEGYLFLRQQ